MSAAAAASPRMSEEAGRGLTFVFFAGLLYGSAGIFSRALPYDPWTVLAWRSLGGALLMATLHLIQRRRLAASDWRLGPGHWLLVPVGAAATISYILALSLTTVADVMIVYATAPFVTAGVAWLWSGEQPTRRLMIASGVALAGVALMLGGGDASPGRWWGAFLVLFMNIGFALTLVLARRRPDMSMLPLNVYMLLLASLVGFALAPHRMPDAGGLAGMLVFGVLTVGLAMTFFLIGARQAPSAEVSLLGITDVVIAPVSVFLVFGENPGVSALVGGLVVAGAIIWNVWPALRRRGRKPAKHLTSGA